ncbi:MAG: hypothetical protein R3B09_10905 [Nannocystaceae bacterium]
MTQRSEEKSKVAPASIREEEQSKSATRMESSKKRELHSEEAAKKQGPEAVRREESIKVTDGALREEGHVKANPLRQEEPVVTAPSRAREAKDEETPRKP